MSTKAAERKLVVPGKEGWVEVNIQATDTTFLDGVRLFAPAYKIQVATRYPTFEDGSRVASKTQAQVAQFLREYNEANGTDFRYPTLHEDEAMRAQLGQNHTMFDENFARNGQNWHRGYVADFTRPVPGYKPLEGINGQMLVTRLVGYRMPDGDHELGVVALAPSGMVPTLSREQLEKLIKKDGLKRLEQLRGREIFEKGDEAVGVKDALGYVRFTLDHDAQKGGKLVTHSHHVYTPSQNDDETVGGRGASWYEHHGGRGCFRVVLRYGAGSSDPDWSFPLVRGGGVVGEVTRPGAKLRL